MKKQNITTGFQNVDEAETEFLVNFLAEINQSPAIQECLKEEINWLDIQPGQHILDIGCGIGDQALEMAKKVGPSGKVIGTDLSKAMVQISQERHSNSGLPLSFETANATEQPFPDQSFDRVRTERVLMYVPDLNKAFQEFYRLLKPKGKLLIFDLDWDALAIPHSNKTLTRKIIEFVSDSFPHGRVGINLLRHFNEFKFYDVRVKNFGLITPLDFFKRVCEGVIITGIEKGIFQEKEITTWWSHIEEEEQKGNFLASFSGFLAIGSK